MSFLLFFDTDLYFRYEFFRLRCVAVVNRVQLQDIPGYLKPSRLGFLHKRFNFLRRLCVGAAVEGGQIAAGRRISLFSRKSSAFCVLVLSGSASSRMKNTEWNRL